MARPATEEDYRRCNEDWVETHQNSSAMTANTAVAVIDHKIDTGEMILLESVGTNGGRNIKLEIKNKGDLIGEAIFGDMAPLNPADKRYKLKVPYVFEAGDHLKIYATPASSTGTTYTKFDARGLKNDNLR